MGKRGAKCTTNSANMVWDSESYKECQKNLAASIGGFALDGCQEYIASGEQGTDLALICAACGCHRSFHRRVVDQEVVELDVVPECSSSTSSMN